MKPEEGMGPHRGLKPCGAVTIFIDIDRQPTTATHLYPLPKHNPAHD